MKNDLWNFSLNYLENVFLKLENISLDFLENISLDFLENISLNYLENYSLANFFGMNNFIKLNDYGKGHKWSGFLFNRKINSKKKKKKKLKKLKQKETKNKKDFFQIINSLILLL